MSSALSILRERIASLPHFTSETIFVASPGRINIIGEHTDYNDGFVLPAAIDKRAYLALCTRPDAQIVLHATDLGETYQTTLEQLAPLPGGHWANYLLGPLAQWLQAGLPVSGFVLALHSTIPIGSGLSSSAAVECAMLYALQQAYATQVPRMQLVHMAQQAEHMYTGVRCGIMDMFASVMATEHHALKLDCRSLQYQQVSMPASGLTWVLINSMVKHSLASSAYNQRRQQCEQAVNWVQHHHTQVKALRDCTPAMLQQFVRPHSEEVYTRAAYVVAENERVHQACAAMESGHWLLLGQLLLQSHAGLSHQYGVSCAELDWLVAEAMRGGEALGSRMMGGGFGGCTINLVKEDAAESFIKRIQDAYQNRFGLEPEAYVVKTSSGTCRL